MAFRDPFSRMSTRAFVFWLFGGITLISLVLMIAETNEQPVGKYYAHTLTNHTQDSSFTVPAFKVKEGTLYQIVVQNQDASANWVAVGMSLLDKEEQVVNEREMEFWFESGYDPEDGSWSEGNKSERFNFKASKTGKLSAEIYWLRGGSTIPQSYQLTFKISETGTRLVSTYFQNMFGFFFAITMLLMFFWRKES
ncbi:MAG TPA: hypothetical protein DCS93_12745 [Microscillaceae bacterium]|nr:hypothetical protein [Microscillaceae bacterium]